MDVINFNIGILGHVDSGKTSLSKALSTIGSTASFDKNPQSVERGITLDLGFSSFFMDVPGHLRSQTAASKFQITVVDCPGHASLIKTIIGGAQIIDAMVLVIDAIKGFQTQTAECLVIGEITCDKMLIVINKVDLYPKDKRSLMIEKMKKKISLTLQKTKFKDALIVPVSAKPNENENDPIGINELLEEMKNFLFIPKRLGNGPFIMAVDHCFSLKGQGTVMTGTILSGSVALGDTIEVPTLQVTKKVKTIQMFKKPVEKAIQGDRIGMCVTQLEAKSFERGIVTSTGVAVLAYAGIMKVKRIPYYKQEIRTNSKMHVTMGHDTCMATVSFFGLYGAKGMEESFDYDKEYVHQNHLLDTVKLRADESNDTAIPGTQFCLLEFEKPLFVIPNSLTITSKFDTDIHTNTCRLAFYGRLSEIFHSDQYRTKELPKLKVYKTKQKEGVIERLVNEQEVIVKDLFKKETNVDLFTGLKVKLSTGEDGLIEGSFGKSGKVKVRVPGCLSSDTQAKLKTTKKKEKVELETEAKNEVVNVYLNFKRFSYDQRKKILQ
ncbi:selenocysteine-specific elongation factor-like [Artemia franciscana]|uniref:Selenocysteine-specific elongation factor n=1 Tax=Artemia franciscana TaxID=6661 RepID=A0AA88ICI7_ARTSF|nr:hypothetical protein QYM36_003864 [Artemia franciscana]